MDLTEDAYVGGPLIKDKLFIFAAVEGERREGNSTGSVSAPFKTDYRYDNPKWYGKLDWNITDSNILEITAASRSRRIRQRCTTTTTTRQDDGGFSSYDTSTKNGADLYTGKFTSYITDDLTLTALYGKMKGTYYTEIAGCRSDHAAHHHAGPTRIRPSMEVRRSRNSQALTSRYDPAHTSTNTNPSNRSCLPYRRPSDRRGYRQPGRSATSTMVRPPPVRVTPGNMTNSAHPTRPIIGSPGANPFVDATANYPNGQDGYYVAKYINTQSASVRTTQRAQYIEDTWQVNDQWLLKIGLRNDQFTNYQPGRYPVPAPDQAAVGAAHRLHLGRQR